jgi:stress response protein SCP2
MIQNNCIVVNNIQISCDYETGEGCGAGGTFQVESVFLDTDFGEIEVTEQLDQGRHFYSLDEVASDLGFNPASINIEEV